MKDPVLAGTVRATCTKPVHDFHKWVHRRDEFSRMFHREVRRLPSPARSPPMWPGARRARGSPRTPALPRLPRRPGSHVHFRQVWDKHQLDGIIAPTLAIPALPHE